ncbi:MAG: hypothetical protein WKG00_18180 [Polyangiaceae bacterium]
MTRTDVADRALHLLGQLVSIAEEAGDPRLAAILRSALIQAEGTHVRNNLDVAVAFFGDRMPLEVVARVRRGAVGRENDRTPRSWGRALQRGREALTVEEQLVLLDGAPARRPRACRPPKRIPQSATRNRGVSK